MAEIVLLPKLGIKKDGVIEVWLKKEGDSVKTGEAIFECKIDKSLTTVAARSDGVLLKILLEEWQSARVLSPVAVIGLPGEDADSALKAWKQEQGK